MLRFNIADETLVRAVRGEVPVDVEEQYDRWIEARERVWRTD